MMLVLLASMALLLPATLAADSLKTCTLSSGYRGNCRTRASCASRGVSTGTGTCPGASGSPDEELCCTVQSCFVGGLRGVCVNKNAGGCSGGQTHERYCTGGDDVVCCTRGQQPTCKDNVANGNVKVRISNVRGSFRETDREAGPSGGGITVIQYCGTPVSSPCSGAIKPYSSAQVRWSNPSVHSNDQTFTGKSGLGFQPMTSIGDVPINAVFPIGTFTHYNFVVRDSTARFTHLVINMDVAGVRVPEFKYKLGIDETSNTVPLNQCAYDSIVPCADKIDFPDNGFSFQNGVKSQGTVKFRYGNVDLTLELHGFKRDCADKLALDHWYTQERVVNQAVLYGRITRSCPIANDCVGQKVIYEEGKCRCEQPKPTPSPPTPVPNVPTPQPTPEPTPNPTPRPPPKQGHTYAPTPNPTPSPPTPPTLPPTPIPNEIIIIEPTPQPPTPNTAPTPVPCTGGWFDCMFPNAPTPNPPTQPDQVPPPNLVFESSGLDKGSEDNTILYAAIAGGVAAFLILMMIVIALCVLTGAAAAMTGAAAAAPANEHIVEGNPLFQQQVNEQHNPLFYSTGPTGSAAGGAYPAAAY